MIADQLGNRAAGVVALDAPVTQMTVPLEGLVADALVRVRMEAAGVGNWDELVRQRKWDVGRPTPMVLGVEGAGVVTATGASVRAVAAGDEVLFHSTQRGLQGSWAQFSDVPAEHLAVKPDGVGWAAAAAFPVPALTAAQALDAVSAKEPTWFFVHGGGGVTGGLAVQMAIARGHRVLATAGPSSAPRLKGFGVSAVFDYRDATWPAAVLRLVPQGVEAGVNAVPGQEATTLSVVADSGRLATITGKPPATERGVTVTDVYVEPNGSRLTALVAGLTDGTLHMDIASTYPLEQAREALLAAVSGKAGGAVVLRP